MGKSRSEIRSFGTTVAELVTASFIPPRPQRELRDLTRRRRKMIEAATYGH